MIETKDLPDYEKIAIACKILNAHTPKEDRSESNLDAKHDILHFCFEEVGPDELTEEETQIIEDCDLFYSEGMWSRFTSC